MSTRVACITLLVTLLVATLRSAEEMPKTRMKDVLKARIAADAKKAEAKKAEAKKTAPVSTPAKADSGPPPAVESDKSEPTARKSSASRKPTTNAAKDAPTVLPKVEVRKSRITELDQKLAKQEQDIARERKNLKASEVDTALNDSKIARPLAIFGGESSQFRQRVASERVELMETEKDLIEAIARASSKEQKQELQKQLDELKAFRRELEKSLR